MKHAVVALTRGGGELAAKIAAVEDCQVYLYAQRVEGDDPPPGVKTFTSLPQLYAEILSEYSSVILIMALGIVIRTIVPYLRGKDQDPAVLVIDEQGKYVVSALSGHLGGANKLAQQLAAKLGGTAVITTSTDVQGKMAVDSLAVELGWQVEPLSGLRQVNGALANGEAIQFITDCDYLIGKTLMGCSVADVNSVAQQKTNALVMVSNRHRHQSKDPSLYLRPANVYLGVGCRKGIEFSQVWQAVRHILQQYNVSEKSINGIASCTVKEGEAALEQLAQQLAVPLVFYTAAELGGVIKQYNLMGSDFVKSKIGVEAVCEPAAMKAATVPRLIASKQVFPGVTVAVAEDASIL